MKKFLRRFKKSTLIVTLVLALTLIGAGSVYAYYTVHTTTVQGTVNEAFSIAGATGDGAWAQSGMSGTWTVPGFPGDTKTLNLVIANAASVALNATVTITGNCSDMTGAGIYSVPAFGTAPVNIVWVVNVSSPPGTCVSTVNISR